MHKKGLMWLIGWTKSPPTSSTTTTTTDVKRRSYSSLQEQLAEELCSQDNHHNARFSTSASSSSFNNSSLRLQAFLHDLELETNSRIRIHHPQKQKRNSREPLLSGKSATTTTTTTTTTKKHKKHKKKKKKSKRKKKKTTEEGEAEVEEGEDAAVDKMNRRRRRRRRRERRHRRDKEEENDDDKENNNLELGSVLGSKHRRHKVTDIVIVGDQDTVFSEVTLSNQYHNEHPPPHLVVQLQECNPPDNDNDDEYFHKQCLARAVAMPWFEADEEYRRNRCQRNKTNNNGKKTPAPSLVVLSSTNSTQPTPAPQQPTRDWYANIHNDMMNNNDQENTYLEIHFPAATKQEEEEEEEHEDHNNDIINNNGGAAAAPPQEDMGRLLDASQHSSKSVFFRLDLESDHTRQESLLGAYAALTSLAEANSFVAQMNSYYSSSDDSSCSSSSSYTSYSSSSSTFFDEQDEDDYYDDDNDDDEEGSLNDDDEDLQPVRKRSNNTPETSYVLLESDDESVFTR